MNVHELEGNFYKSTGITENLISGGFRRRILVFRRKGREGTCPSCFARMIGGKAIANWRR
jgi:hypothetical protein